MTSKEALEKLRYNYFNTKNDDETEFQNLCDRIGNDLDVLEIFRRGYGDTKENQFYTVSTMKLTKEEYDEAKDGDGVYISNIKGKRGTVQHGKIQTLKTSPDVGVVLYNGQYMFIRKFTPRECFRLMGVRDEDFDRLASMPDLTLYHLAGDSIVVDVLMAIFRNMF